MPIALSPPSTGSTVQKTGGRKSSNIVDYALLPTFLIQEVEILAGPHSALYDSKSIGGVINMISERPHRRASLKPEATLTTSYGSYETWNNIATVQGAVKDFTYDMAYQQYSTDGYLRHSDTDIQTLYGRIGYLLPADGFVTLSLSGTDTDRDGRSTIPASPMGTMTGSYPLIEDAAYDAFQDPTWDGESHAWRFNLEQPSPIGVINLGAYTSKDGEAGKLPRPPPPPAPELDTDWWQEGLKIQDEFQWTENHRTILGV